MCLLNEISQFNSVKDSIMVEVAVPAVVMWGDGIHSDLHITEGGGREAGLCRICQSDKARGRILRQSS